MVILSYLEQKELRDCRYCNVASDAPLGKFLGVFPWVAAEGFYQATPGSQLTVSTRVSCWQIRFWAEFKSRISGPERLSTKWSSRTRWAPKGQKSVQIKIQGQNRPVRISASGWGWDFRMKLDPSNQQANSNIKVHLMPSSKCGWRAK